MFKRVLVYVEIFRPHNMLVAAMCVVAGYVISGGGGAGGVWPAAVFTALVTGAGNIINDFHDVHIDRVNKPRRPLPSGRLAMERALKLYVLSTVSVTAGALAFLPLKIAVLVLAWEAALYAYARWIKQIFVVGNMLVALIASSAFFAGGLLAGNLGPVWIAVAIAFTFVLSRELVKGAEDVEGDRDAYVNTAAVVAGVERTTLWASSLMLLLAAAIPLPALTGYYGNAYLWIMELTVVPGLAVAAILILRRPGKAVFSRVSWILKVEMFFGVVAVGMGKW